MTPPIGENRLTREQKTGFVLLLIFGVLTVSLGFLQMRNTIYNPFLVKAEEKNGQGINSFYNDTTRLQQIDTDQDGLNDYEELEFYGTSPYLPDTDSDGITDQTELLQGTDPLCPEGEACGEDVITQPEKSEGIISPLAEDSQTPYDLLMGAVPDTAMNTSTATALNTEEILSNPEAIRLLLINTGSITAEQLEAFSDEELLALVEELMKEEQ